MEAGAEQLSQPPVRQTHDHIDIIHTYIYIYVNPTVDNCFVCLHGALGLGFDRVQAVDVARKQCGPNSNSLNSMGQTRQQSSMACFPPTLAM